MVTERSRNGAAILEEPAGLKLASSRSTTVARDRYSHGPGITLETFEPAKAAPVVAEKPVEVQASAPVTEEVTPRASETLRSHDAGIILDNGSTVREARKRAGTSPANFASLLFSSLELAGATARYALDQFRTGYRMLRHPGGALELAQRSIESCTDAMNKIVEETHHSSAKTTN